MAAMIFSTHRQLESRPGWGEDPPCPGRMRVVDESTPSWTVACDACLLEIGVPPRHQEQWLAEVTHP